jgi:hypothetical protein
MGRLEKYKAKTVSLFDPYRNNNSSFSDLNLAIGMKKSK